MVTRSLLRARFGGLDWFIESARQERAVAARRSVWVVTANLGAPRGVVDVDGGAKQLIAPLRLVKMVGAPV